MNITFNIYYKSENGNAKRFANEMIKNGIVDEIKSKNGNLRYDYFIPLDDEDTVLLIDSWENQEALDEHHNSETMKKITELRNKYDLHMTVEKYVKDDSNMDNNNKFIRK
ncbi:MAG: antibiotic biosynthesis monooxygenase [Lachnospiraceae bacterium]|nr:antibiotic biosynthesis monooxygenase [Lachnospiraceae bacterium]